VDAIDRRFFDWPEVTDYRWPCSPRSFVDRNFLGSRAAARFRYLRPNTRAGIDLSQSNLFSRQPRFGGDRTSRQAESGGPTIYGSDIWRDHAFRHPLDRADRSYVPLLPIYQNVTLNRHRLAAAPSLPISRRRSQVRNGCPPSATPVTYNTLDHNKKPSPPADQIALTQNLAGSAVIKFLRTTEDLRSYTPDQR